MDMMHVSIRWWLEIKILLIWGAIAYDALEYLGKTYWQKAGLLLGIIGGISLIQSGVQMII